MLSSKNRLTTDNDFAQVKKSGRMFQSESFGLSCLKRSGGGEPRFGIIVSSQISKNASKRNYIRRGLAEAVRHNINNVKKGYDCVILAKPVSTTKYVNDLMAEVKEALKNSQLLIKP